MSPSKPLADLHIDREYFQKCCEELISGYEVSMASLHSMIEKTFDVKIQNATYHESTETDKLNDYPEKIADQCQLFKWWGGRHKLLTNKGMNVDFSQDIVESARKGKIPIVIFGDNVLVSTFAKCIEFGKTPILVGMDGSIPTKMQQYAYSGKTLDIILLDIILA